MLRATKIRIRFKAPLHIAARGVGFERVNWVLHSDTLYSAIVTVWNQIFPNDVTKLTEAELPFLLSSAFPFQGALEFYPKPLVTFLPEDANGNDRHFNLKKLSKVEFIESALFQQIVSGERLNIDSIEPRQGGRFWVKASEDISVNENNKIQALTEENIIHEVEVPRVVIDRVTNKGMHYFISELHFAKDAGLFFWIRFNEQSLKQRFIQVLRVLGEEGLGLDRTSGKGHFYVNGEDIVEETLPGLEDSQRFLTLSLYHPQKEEINNNYFSQSGYDLVQRGGYVSGKSYRRQTLTMFAEGSVFKNSSLAAYGKKCEVLDSDFALSAIGHPVYRFGYAFPIGFFEE